MDIKWQDFFLLITPEVKYISAECRIFSEEYISWMKENN